MSFPIGARVRKIGKNSMYRIPIGTEGTVIPSEPNFGAPVWVKKHYVDFRVRLDRGIDGVIDWYSVSKYWEIIPEKTTEWKESIWTPLKQPVEEIC